MVHFNFLLFQLKTKSRFSMLNKIKIGFLLLKINFHKCRTITKKNMMISYVESCCAFFIDIFWYHLERVRLSDWEQSKAQFEPWKGSQGPLFTFANLQMYQKICRPGLVAQPSPSKLSPALKLWSFLHFCFQMAPLHIKQNFV